MADGDFQFPQAGSSSEPFEPVYVAPRLRPRFQGRTWLHILLFLITLCTTTVVGGLHYLSFIRDFERADVSLGLEAFLVHGFWYSGTLLAILGAHEMGHYVFCRKYNVDASLPYFLPAPILTGTLGAVIRIREAFPSRKVLFDIGVAGPIGGFIVLVPALFIGMSLSNITLSPTEGSGWNLGEPLLFQLAARLTFGVPPSGYTINIHPMVFAAWFGMLATALNLLPFGQLDGGHITYATLGRVSTPISIATVSAAIVMTFISVSWLFMTLMMVAMLLILGPRHPRVIDEYEPLGPGRRALAIVALAMLVLCFTPVPIEPMDFFRR
jgi:membrane-associated protease RseP (regulator of RpoE activity)